MKYINLLTNKYHIIYVKKYEERISEVKAKIAFEKRLVNGEESTIQKHKLEIRIIKTHIRHLNELQKLAKLMYPEAVKNEKA